MGNKGAFFRTQMTSDIEDGWEGANSFVGGCKIMVKATADPGPSTPTVAIVGRPNVGKSALFNRILTRRLAIVHEEQGVTRDRITAISDWFGKRFLLVDTGGLGFYKNERSPTVIDALVRQQLDIAIECAEKIILVVDVQSGILPLDLEISDLLRQYRKEVIVAVNKVDNEDLADLAFEFTKLGFKDIIPISCLHNTNIGELLDQVTLAFDKRNSEFPEKIVQYPKIAVVGRPNVGKSSIVNRFLNEDRVIVSEVAGTTRDAIDIPASVEVDNDYMTLILIDTAGLRQKRSIKSPVEYFSMTRTQAAVRRADIVLIVLDATTAIKNLDKKICSFVTNQQKPCILVANKWDLAGKKLKQKVLFNEIRESLPFLDYSPMLTCCALSGYNFKLLIKHIVNLHQRLQIKISTSIVNGVIKDIFGRYQPASKRRKSFKVYYGVHAHNSPPTFILFTNKSSTCSESDLTYIKRRMRKAFGLAGLPIQISLRER